MDYYKKRSRAIRMIDNMLKAKPKRIVIELAVMRKYGFPSKFVDQYLIKLSQAEEINYINGELEYE